MAKVIPFRPVKKPSKNKSKFVPALCVATAVTAGVLPDEQVGQITDHAIKLKDDVVDMAVSVGLSSRRIKGNVSINSG